MSEPPTTPASPSSPRDVITVAVVDDQLVTLLPGESVTFRVSGAGLDASDHAALVSPSVLRTANQLVADWR